MNKLLIYCLIFFTMVGISQSDDSNIDSLLNYQEPKLLELEKSILDTTLFFSLGSCNYWNYPTRDDSLLKIKEGFRQFKPDCSMFDKKTKLKDIIETYDELYEFLYITGIISQEGENSFLLIFFQDRVKEKIITIAVCIFDIHEQEPTLLFNSKRIMELKYKALESTNFDINFFEMSLKDFKVFAKDNYMDLK